MFNLDAVDFWLRVFQWFGYLVAAFVTVGAVRAGVRFVLLVLREGESAPVVDRRPIPYAIGQFGGSRPRSDGWTASPVPPGGFQAGDVCMVAAAAWLLSECVSDVSSADCSSVDVDPSF